MQGYLEKVIQNPVARGRSNYHHDDKVDFDHQVTLKPDTDIDNTNSPAAVISISGFGSAIPDGVHPKPETRNPEPETRTRNPGPFAVEISNLDFGVLECDPGRGTPPRTPSAPVTPHTL